MNASLNPDQVFHLCLVVAAIGIAVILALVWIGKRIFTLSQYSFGELGRFLDFWRDQNIRPNLPRYFLDSLTESLQRRNEFWTTYGQVVVSVLIVIILALLLLTKTISGEAGLPLLSAISGFAIAKGATSTNSPASSGPEREQSQ